MNDDKIYIAYTGGMGEQAKESTRMRIEWILSHIEEQKKVLDVGCSQGIISILAAEKGCNVTGVDIQEENIEFAKKLLADTYSDVTDLVEFKNVDFFEYDDSKKYDYILMTEILEHLEEPLALLKKTEEFLEEEGTVIITVPFGVMLCPDHRSTFYLSSIYHLINQVYSIQDIKILDRWMGIVAGKKECDVKSYELNLEKFIEQEQHFEKVDRRLSEQVSELYSRLQLTNKKYKDITIRYSKLKQQYIQLHDNYKS